MQNAGEVQVVNVSGWGAFAEVWGGTFVDADPQGRLSAAVVPTFRLAGAQEKRQQVGPRVRTFQRAANRAGTENMWN